MQYKRADIVIGGLVYAIGDTAAAFLSHEFSWMRLGGIILIGATVYAFEIPNYFNWIDRKIARQGSLKTSVQRAILVALYFNPLWIARHFLFLKVIMGQTDQIGWGLLSAAGLSFLVNLPVSLLANYVIINKVALRWRFFANTVFSALMAVYYALSAVWFNG